MAKHLTKTNSDNDNHLGSVYKDNEHLVVVSQASNWTNKEFVVVPTEFRFKFARASGLEAYPDTIPNNAIKADMQTLITSAHTALDNTFYDEELKQNYMWSRGNKCIFAYYSRGCDPYLFCTAGETNNYSGVGYCAVAYLFDAKHLHFSTMTSGGESFSVKLRFYQPSQIFVDYNKSVLMFYGIIPVYELDGGANILNVKILNYDPLSEDEGLPEPSSIDTDPMESITFTHNMCNDKASQTADRDVWGHVLCYNAFTNNSTLGQASGLRMWHGGDQEITGEEISEDSREVTYQDVTISSENTVNFFKNNPGKFWVVCKFKNANPIYEDHGLSWSGIRPHMVVSLVIQRIEMIFTCTSEKFN